MSQHTKGLFITVEGIEGVGKSTVMAFIDTYLSSVKKEHIMTREPGGTEIAEKIRSVILSHHTEKMVDDTELLLFFAARAQHIHAVIKPSLAEGVWVICDRFTDASYAYQSGGRGLSAERIAVLESWVQGGLQPDLTLLLDAPVEIGMARAQGRSELDRIEQEKLEFFNRVRDAYLARAKQYSQRYRVIDASKSLAEVQKSIIEILVKYLS